MFSKENMNIENDWSRQEDFDDEGNNRFLKEVYQLIKAIEYREVELKAEEKELKRMLNGDSLSHSTHHGLKHTHQENFGGSMMSISMLKSEVLDKPKDKLSKSMLIKTMMCPLGDKCQGDVRPRWPISNTMTIEKFGANCELAHHVFELKFQ